MPMRPFRIRGPLIPPPLTWSRTPFVPSRALSSWNPFKRRTVTLEEAQRDAEPADPTVLEVKQLLRTTHSPSELTSLLHRLHSEAVPNRHTFALMNEVIDRLDHTDTEAIPGLTNDESLRIFEHVTSTVSKLNFKSARFVPRLYLQLSRCAIDSGDEGLLMATLDAFVRYLHRLEMEDQLVVVLEQFLADTPKGMAKKSKRVIQKFVESTSVHPSLLVRIVKLYPTLLKLSVSRSVDYLESKVKEMYTLDNETSASIKELVAMVLSRKTDAKSLSHVLRLCQLIGDLLAEEEPIVIFKLLDSTSHITDDEATFMTKRLIQNPVCKTHKDFAKVQSILSTHPDAALMWRIYNHGLDTPASWDLEHYHLALISLVNSAHSAQVPDLLDELKTHHLPTSETYKILMQRHLYTRDTVSLKQIFDESMNEGIDWSGEHILYKFFTTLAEVEGTENPKEVFGYMKRIKVHLTWLDPESYNSLVTLAFRNRFVDDVVESFKRELPDQNVQYKRSDYPQLYDTVYSWITGQAEDAEDVWAVYTEFAKHFEVPHEWYFPVMQRLEERPDWAFEVFQSLKRVHRRSGAIPPPGAEVYAYLFKLFGRSLYVEGVETLDAIFKVDLTMNTSVPLLNAIMDAYCSIQNFNKVSQLYEQILELPAGPDNETVSIMIKAHTFFSLDNVRHFWNNMDELGVLPNEDNFRRYIIAHCYHGQEEVALGIAQQMDELDVSLSPAILKGLYQWSKRDETRLMIREWAERSHSGVWNQVKDDLGAVVVAEVPKGLEIVPTKEELMLVKS